MSIEIRQPIVGEGDETLPREFRQDIQAEPFTDRIESLKPGTMYDVKVELDHSKWHTTAKITAPDGWTLENVFMASSGNVILRFNKAD